MHGLEHADKILRNLIERGGGVRNWNIMYLFIKLLIRRAACRGSKEANRLDFQHERGN